MVLSHDDRKEVVREVAMRLHVVLSFQHLLQFWHLIFLLRILLCVVFLLICMTVVIEALNKREFLVIFCTYRTALLTHVFLLEFSGYVVTPPCDRPLHLILWPLPDLPPFWIPHVERVQQHFHHPSVVICLVQRVHGEEQEAPRFLGTIVWNNKAIVAGSFSEFHNQQQLDDR